jgi:hypothetical protein
VLFDEASAALVSGTSGFSWKLGLLDMATVDTALTRPFCRCDMLDRVGVEEPIRGRGKLLTVAVLSGNDSPVDGLPTAVDGLRLLRLLLGSSEDCRIDVVT